MENNSETTETIVKNIECITSNSTIKEKLQEKIEQDNIILEKFNKSKRNKCKKIDNRKVCQICGTKQTNLKQHMMIHTGERPFKCKFCKKEFSQVGHFQHHVNIHTGIKPYTCNVCEKSFPSPSGLTLHKVIIYNFFRITVFYFTRSIISIFILLIIIHWQPFFF